MRIRITLLLLLAALPLSGQMPTAVGRRGMVSAGNEIAARFGLNILRRGGNAIDAAVATGFALAVIHPRAGNIGGGGFMVIRLADGTTTSIDFREKAPQAASRNMYLDAQGLVITDLSRKGILASGVPGSVRGYGLAHERYGRLDWKLLLAEAVALAENGFAVSYQMHRDLTAKAEKIAGFEETRRIFYRDGKPPNLNALLRQPDLAATLRRIAEQGPDEFYTGQTARLLVRHMQRHDGLITAQDLADYQALERPAVQFEYRDVEVISMGPPSSGGIVLAEILNQWEQVDMGAMGYHSAEHVHAMVEAERRAYADRARYLGDQDFVNIPTGRLISDDYAASQWRSFTGAWATDSRALAPDLMALADEAGETTHFSVIDRQGNAVAVTTTINSSFGSGMVVEGAGFFLNNEMDDFVSKPGVPNMYGLIGSAANAIAPGKRMLSSMTPTIITRDGNVLLITGSPGGSTIMTTVAQVISNVVDFGMPATAAVYSPRIHHQWLPDRIRLESRALQLETRRRLMRMGHRFYDDDGRGREIRMGSAHTIWVDPETGWYFGIADPRSDSGAMGY